MTSNNESQGTTLQYTPMKSFVSPSFWHKLAEIKLEYDRLSDAPKPISGYYTNRFAKSCLLEADYSAFSSNFQAPKFCHHARGVLYNKNTIEDFKNCDKNALLLEAGRSLIEDFKNDQILEDLSRLARFIVLSFADLKSHNYYYWFAFPCPLSATLSLQKEAYNFASIPSLQAFTEVIKNIPNEQQNFFVLKANNMEKFYTLKEVLLEHDLEQESELYYFCFADASEYASPSWHMRTYANLLFYKCPSLVGKVIKFLGVRFDAQMQLGASLIWEVQQNEALNFDDIENVKIVGWEPNLNDKMGPRKAAMKDSMDPAILAENSVNLNLKLMKWRLVPELNLEAIADTKCLLFGAGTLGCAVARNLLGWGFTTITIIDNGRVSFANPVRQCLYTIADAMKGNAMKADVAAVRLREINPSTIATGYVMQIPMPGHTVGESLQEQTEADLQKIAQLVQEHDALFLLTDSRESRWLPTLLGAAYGKVVINAALGFDSYLVMRHGSHRSSEIAGDAAEPRDIGNLKCLSGNQLGCYFCNDVTGPGNSLKDRTLDQQCTVTRPGVANIAASYAVELLVSLLQHPQRDLAPAYICATGTPNAKVPEGILGIIPHSIRGMLFDFNNILPATEKFSQCIACSEQVIKEYRAHGNAFLFKAFETAKYLEDLTGISAFQDLSNEIIDFDDAELEMSDDDE